MRPLPKLPGARTWAPFYLTALALALGAILATPVAALAAQDNELTPLGEVDLTQLSFFDEDKLTIEINLSGSLMQILTQSLQEEEGELASLISKLQAIRVNFFSLEDDGDGAVRKEARAVGRQLIDAGWESIVRVQEDDETIQILVRHDAGKIAGLFALFVEEGDSAGVINIVGEVDPAQIARIGRSLNIRALEAIDVSLLEEDGPEEDGGQP